MALGTCWASRPCHIQQSEYLIDCSRCSHLLLLNYDPEMRPHSSSLASPKLAASIRLAAWWARYNARALGTPNTARVQPADFLCPFVACAYGKPAQTEQTVCKCKITIVIWDSFWENTVMGQIRLAVTRTWGTDGVWWRGSWLLLASWSPGPWLASRKMKGGTDSSMIVRSS